jgi:hypothetical protein
MHPINTRFGLDVVGVQLLGALVTIAMVLATGCEQPAIGVSRNIGASVDAGVDACPDPPVSCPIALQGTILLPQSAISQTASVTADKCPVLLSDNGDSVLVGGLGSAPACTITLSLADGNRFIAVALFRYARCCGWLNVHDTTGFEPLDRAALSKSACGSP